MAEEVHELVVKLAPDGAEETQAALDSVSSTFDETADDVEDSAATMEEFSGKFQGAMEVVVAGLGVATAGLASQIPIIGELASGLFAIIESLAFRIDSVLRPALQPVSDALFGIAAGIDEADGALGAFIDTVATVGFALGGLASAAFSLGAIFGEGGMLAGGLAAVKTLFSTLAGAISTVAGAFAAFVAGSLTAQVALGGLLGLFGVGILEVTGFMDWIRRLGQQVGNALPAWARDGLISFIGLFTGFLPIAGAAISGFVSGFLEGGLSEGIDQMVKNAKQALGIFVTAWKNTMQRAHRFVAKGINKIISGIESGVNEAIGALNQLPGNNFQSVSLGRVNVPAAPGSGGGGGGGGPVRQRGQALREQMGAGQNAFANEDRLRIDIQPAKFRKFLNAELDSGPSNQGRGG